MTVKLDIRSILVGCVQILHRPLNAIGRIYRRSTPQPKKPPGGAFDHEEFLQQQNEASIAPVRPVQPYCQQYMQCIKYNILECGPMPNVMAALPNIGGALCSTPQSLADAHYWSAVQ